MGLLLSLEFYLSVITEVSSGRKWVFLCLWNSISRCSVITEVIGSFVVSEILTL